MPVPNEPASDASLASDWPRIREAMGHSDDPACTTCRTVQTALTQVRRDATREALLAADERIGQMIASGDWENQYSMGFAATVSQVIFDGMPLDRADTTPEPAARAVPTEGEAWECGPHTNAWNGHDARCRHVPAPTPSTVGDDEVEAQRRVIEDWLHDERWPYAYDLSHAIVRSDWFVSRTPSPSVDGAALAESIAALCASPDGEREWSNQGRSGWTLVVDVSRLRAALARAAAGEERR